MKDLNQQVAEAAGYTLRTVIYSGEWINADGDFSAWGNEFTPSTSYDQIIACIEAKGWDWVKLAMNSCLLAVGTVTPSDLCRAFLAACEAENPQPESEKIPK